MLATYQIDSKQEPAETPQSSINNDKMRPCETPDPSRHHPTDRELVSSVLVEGQLKTEDATLLKLGTKNLMLADEQEKTGFRFSSPSTEPNIQRNSWPGHLKE